ncbi:histidine--tRNA ligase [Ferrimicrobium acidiphilum]|uniref:histidine--tRNA ligase n=1 Tax=Ferrimicrobium acidiphilum TaxID=121039 RepID=UPI0023F305FA|nr:ATP phosphoribosyltransferase regulatory subunit [Ferrimicrobium acidiphilum]MCL5053343.1 ATP phosphoribosyltransferase regulatory subunit [Gammaproteobacteria bacterium]
MQAPRPMRGMRDVLPGEAGVRLHTLQVIREAYRQHGFFEIETPVVETMETLTSSGAGENEKLMFKVLKRGERLDAALAGTEDELADAALRFDLTVPLARFYSINQSKLPKPFYAMQLGPVFRAERPQRGRFRQFLQTDIDVLGDPSYLAEVQLLIAATSALHKIGLEGFEIRLNDRRILEFLLNKLEIPDDRFTGVMIALDKLDKQSVAEVVAELQAKGIAADQATHLVAVLGELSEASSLKALADLGVPKALIANLSAIQQHVTTSVRDVPVVFDPLIVRGIGYYTSTVYEIIHPKWSGSIGGGGRYDQLLARFGTDTPACGVSLGFERVVGLVEELGLLRETGARRLTVIFEPDHQTAEALSKARHFRREGYLVTLLAHQSGARSPMKRIALSAEELKAEGSVDSFYHFTVGVDEAPRLLIQ